MPYLHDLAPTFNPALTTGKSPAIAGTVPALPVVAIAVGAGWIKGWNGSEFMRFRSLINPTLPRGITPSDELLKVKITNSPHNRTFLVGEELEGKTGTRPLKHGTLKAEYSGALILTTAAYLARGNAMVTCKLNVSAPTAEIRDALTETLKGAHTVTLNNYPPITLNVQDITVVPEDVGSARALAGAGDQAVAVIGLGFQNTTVTGWDPIKNRPLSHHNLTPGVGDLFESIADELNTDGQRYSAEAIRLGVDSRTYKVYGHGDTEFKEVYERCFARWIGEVLSQVKDVAYNTIQRCPQKYFCGGGNRLEGMDVIANRMKFQLVDDPQKLELMGLLG